MFNTQQLNSTTRVNHALTTFVDAYFDLLQEKKKSALIGVPAVNDANAVPPLVNYPAPGELSYITDRNTLTKQHSAIDVIETFMNTLNVGIGGGQGKKPLDAIVESLP